MSKDQSRIRLPKNFHAILKVEAIKHGMPMTKYLDGLAKEIESKHGSIENYFKSSRSKED